MHKKGDSVVVCFALLVSQPFFINLNTAGNQIHVILEMSGGG
jgi:hypothetical protein